MGVSLSENPKTFETTTLYILIFLTNHQEDSYQVSPNCPGPPRQG